MTFAAAKNTQIMGQSLLWQALTSFTPAEWRDLERFTNSPFFNRKAQVARLCVLLR